MTMCSKLGLFILVMLASCSQDGRERNAVTEKAVSSKENSAEHSGAIESKIDCLSRQVDDLSVQVRSSAAQTEALQTSLSEIKALLVEIRAKMETLSPSRHVDFRGQGYLKVTELMIRDKQQTMEYRQNALARSTNAVEREYLESRIRGAQASIEELRSMSSEENLRKYVEEHGQKENVRELLREHLGN